MTHASGVDITKELYASWQKCLEDESVRFLQIQLVGESFTEKKIVKKSGDWKADFDLIPPVLHESNPSYIIYRKERKDDWVFMSYTPAGAKIRSRMIFASSRDTVKNSLGPEYISELFFGSEPKEFNFQDYTHSTAKVDDTLAMSNDEIDAYHEKFEDLAPTISSGGVHSVKFPITEVAKKNLILLGDSKSKVNLVVLEVDKKTETIEFVKSSTSTFGEISKQLDEQRPCYIFYRFTHKHDGKSLSPVIFYYWCPDTANIRKKMLSSSVKSALIDQVENLGIGCATRIEATEFGDIDEQSLLNTLHPKKKVSNKFAKPKPSGSRGSARRGRRTQKT